MPDPEPNATVLPVGTAIGRVVAVFVRPLTLMRELRAQPSIWFAVVVFLVASNVIAAFTFRDRIDPALEQMRDGAASAGAEGRAAGEWIEDHPGTVRILVHGALSAAGILSLVGWAGLIHVSALQYYGAIDPPIRFEHHMSLVAHANLVNVVGVLVPALLGLGERGLSLATVLDLPSASVQGTLADWVSPINFWWLALLALGGSVFYRCRFRDAILVPVGVSLVFRVVQVLMHLQAGGD